MELLTNPKGWYSSNGFEGQMPDHRWQTFDSEKEYHEEFWEELGYKL